MITMLVHVLPAANRCLIQHSEPRLVPGYMENRHEPARGGSSGLRCDVGGFGLLTLDRTGLLFATQYIAQSGGGVAGRRRRQGGLDLRLQAVH